MEQNAFFSYSASLPFLFAQFLSSFLSFLLLYLINRSMILFFLLLFMLQYSRVFYFYTERHIVAQVPRPTGNAAAAFTIAPHRSSPDRAYIAGLWKSFDVNDNRLWDKKNRITLYRCVFSKHRFTFLSTCLRFNDTDNRDENDRFAPIRKLWNMFIDNCKKNYTLSSECR